MIFPKGHKAWLVVNPVLFLAGILLFACLPRDMGKLSGVSYAGLVIAASAMAFSIRKPSDLLTEFGLNAIPRKKYYLLFAGFLAGVIFAARYLQSQDQSMIPRSLTLFAIAAAAIGFTEELLFRGYLQTQLMKISVLWSVLLATLSHTAYKVLLFLALRPIFEVDLKFLFFWTLACGLIFGILKEKSGSTYPPIAGHVAFDVLVYGSLAKIPWWIWA